MICPHYLTADDAGVSFAGKYPADYLVDDVPETLPVWHLVGGLDPLEQADLTGGEPDDDYPVTLRDWIVRDGLKCLKIKLRGTDAEWDYQRLVGVGEMSIETWCRFSVSRFQLHGPPTPNMSTLFSIVCRLSIRRSPN